MPGTAVSGGRDTDGSTIFVGRAFHNGDMVPAKVIPDKRAVYVAHGGEEHSKQEYEVFKKTKISQIHLLIINILLD